MQSDGVTPPSFPCIGNQLVAWKGACCHKIKERCSSISHCLLLQNAKELHVGLRTGFCGSLTTFASWQLSVIQLLIGGKGYQGGQWDQFLVAQFGTGILCAVGAYILGTRFAGASKHLFRKDGTSAHKSTNQRDRKVHYKVSYIIKMGD